VLDVDLRREDVVGTYAGLRPLIAPSSGSTVTASREHRVVVEPNGLVRVSGGKYTTYRVMAADTVDDTLAVLGEPARDRPSATADHRLVGAADRSELDRLSHDLAEAARLPQPIAARLVARHGVEATVVLDLATAEGLQAVLPGSEHLEAEVAWAARRELALSLDDVLSRRMRLAQVLPDRGASMAPRVAQIMGNELDWDVDRQAREVELYLSGANREFAVP